MSASSKTSLVYDELRKRIIQGTYEAGHRLVLSAIARELDVSPIPVREAIRMLEAEGLVTFNHNVGPQVAAFDPETAAQRMETLAILESAAVALAAPLMSAATIDAAESLADKLNSAMAAMDLEAYTFISVAFHETLFRDCPNDYLVNLLHQSWARGAAAQGAAYSIISVRRDEIVAEHREIIRLLRLGDDVDAIEREMRAHRKANIRQYASSNSSLTFLGG